jgi:hypothetical protein
MFRDNQGDTLMDETELLMNKGQLKHISKKNPGKKMGSKKIKPNYKKLYKS